LQVRKNSFREGSDEASHDIDGVATVLEHFEFVSLNHSVLSDQIEQFDAILSIPQKLEEICRDRLFNGAETEDARKGGITRHDLPISPSAEDSREIFGYKTPIMFEQLSLIHQRRCKRHNESK
jgi:hypothetical protein